MIKTNPSSRFALRTLEEIRDGSDVVLQAEKTDSTFTDSKKHVYLCEVVSRGDYGHPYTTDKLAAELVRVNDDNRCLRKKIDRLEKALQKEKARNE